jgi:hypothetical protein
VAVGEKPVSMLRSGLRPLGCDTVRYATIPGEAENGAQLRRLLIDTASVARGFVATLGEDSASRYAWKRASLRGSYLVKACCYSNDRKKISKSLSENEFHAVNHPPKHQAN